MSIAERLVNVANRYPNTPCEITPGSPLTGLRRRMLEDVDRVAFEVTLVSSLISSGGHVADIGGGITLFAPALSASGFKALLVDDFRDRWHHDQAEALELHRAIGVDVLSVDLLSSDFSMPPDTLDVIAAFDVIEHLHHSPKPMLKKLVTALRPGGWLIIGVPNCVNLRKRLTVPFGIGKWSPLQQWYDEPLFRGHVREPDVDDLRYIANDLNLSNVVVKGRNFLGARSRFTWVRLLLPLVDNLLQLRPSLCSNLYMIGQKAA
jgi:2-polyprenyl-3-methyl-5-hydroxy-6-metoxy-1,4-benzoquinol methylase